MNTEPIYKLQPDRTFYLRGFTGVGAAASLCKASPTGFTVSGVFRDMADFCVLVIYDADNTFEHYSIRYLPDFNFAGLSLTFDVSYQGLQPIDSAKYSWIDWAQLDVIPSDGVTDGPAVKVRLWDYATLKSGTYSVAQGTYSIAAPGGCTIYDRLTLFVNNVSFDFVASGGESAVYVAQTFANSVNTYDWSTFDYSSVAVIASADANGHLTLKNARTGHVTVTGSSVTWVDGTRFAGIAAGSAMYLGGTGYVVASIDSPTSLTLTTSVPSAQTAITYLAEYGGVDGNSVTTYMVARPGNVTLAVNEPVLALGGGNSDNVTWTVSLDFSALKIDQIRQAWLTFAPQLANEGAFADTEWNATFANWTVQDPENTRALKCAGPASVRIGNDSNHSCIYSGSGWTKLLANNYWRGSSKITSTAGDSVSVTYSCGQTHDLYVGTSLHPSRATVSVSLDGDQATNLPCALGVTSELVTRRRLRSSVPAGKHVVTLTLAGAEFFLFDYLEAAVASDIPGPLTTYENVSPALDFDTDATYKVSPQRLLWHLDKLGFTGQLNEYLGVFWWNQRRRVGGVWNSATVTFGGTWASADSATITIGTFQISKSVTTWDTADTIAAHFVYYVNAASVSMWAEKTGTGQLTVHTRTPNWGDTISATPDSDSGVITISGNVNVGVDGTWQVDPTSSNPLNYAVRQWHGDLFSGIAAAGLLITTSFSMELVNHPDTGIATNDITAANNWQARYVDGSAVATATGFSNLISSQCAPVPNVTAFQESVYTAMAALQSGAGLTPWLQFGEFLWWYFSSMAQPVGYCSFTDPVSIGVANPHGMSTGDRVVLSGIEGCVSANGTWTITVTDPTHFTVPVPANGTWTAGTGQVRGGSMAYYDPFTSATASSALNRALYRFTCQDDDPTVNGGVDANFLAGQLKAHIDSIRNAVLAQFPDAKFELLYPNDVNNPVCYLGQSIQYPQGGRLNAGVNFHSAWKTQAGSGFDRFKVEALSWGATYRHIDLANQAISFALTAPMSWNLASVAYLIPWFNGDCPWPVEFQAASRLGLMSINFWAYDHLALLSWPLPFPSPTRRSLRLG